MRAGLIRQRVKVQTGTETRDAHGGVIRTFADTATRWASVTPLSGRELYEAQQVVADVTHLVVFRHPNPVTPITRLVHEGRVLNVERVLNKDERDREIMVLCKEVV